MYFARLATGIVLCAALAICSRQLRLDDRYAVELDIIRGVGGNDSIVLSFDVKTTGFIGFAIGRGPSLFGADIFIGGVYSNLGVYGKDYYGHEPGGYVLDQCIGCQNWNVLFGKETDGGTTLTTTRLLNTGDTIFDIEIENSSIIVFWDYGESDTDDFFILKDRRVVNLFTVDDTPSTTTINPDIITTTSRPTTTTRSTTTDPTTTTGPTPRHIYLDTKYTVEFFIIQNGFNRFIELLLKVNKTGYVGFGLSRNPGMIDADLFIGGVHAVNNTLYGRDYHGYANNMPDEDLSGQDWTVLSGFEWEGMTTLKLRHVLNTGNPDEDITIQDSYLYVIWSYGKTDTINHHVARGSRWLNFFVVDDSVTTTTRSPGFGSGSSNLRTNFLFLLMVTFAFWKS